MSTYWMSFTNAEYIDFCIIFETNLSFSSFVPLFKSALFCMSLCAHLGMGRVTLFHRACEGSVQIINVDYEVHGRWEESVFVLASGF